MVEGTVDLRGIRYAYTDTGGDGEPVLLLHGWPDDRTLWRHQLGALADAGFRALALDWPAHGESAPPPDLRRHAVPELGLDLLAVLDALGLERAHVVAHDYGATVAWEAAALHPERFVSFAAISVGHSLEVARDAALHAGRYAWLVLHGLPRASRAWYLASDARRFRRAFADHPDAEQVLARLRGGGDQTFWTIWERANPTLAVLRRHLAGPLRGRRVEIPTMGVYGADDRFMTPSQMRRSGRHVAASWRHETLPGGHWLPLQTPLALDALLLDWLEGRRGRPS